MSTPTHVLAARRAWGTLPAPAADAVPGEWKASFVAPLRRLAPVGLGPLGLPRWHGKLLLADGTGINLVRPGAGGPLEERLPMTWTLDGSPLSVRYPADGPRPWRWVDDRLRVLDERTLLGLTVVGRGPGLPFLLHRVG